MGTRMKKRASRGTPTRLNDPAEYQRFLDMAREVEVDQTPGALDRAFEKVIRPPPRKEQRVPKSRSD